MSSPLILTSSYLLLHEVYKRKRGKKKRYLETEEGGWGKCVGGRGVEGNDAVIFSLALVCLFPLLASLLYALVFTYDDVI